jgi:hypothetical protein
MTGAHRTTKGARSAVKLPSGHLTRVMAIDPSTAANPFRRVDQLPGMAIEPGE